MQRPTALPGDAWADQSVSRPRLSVVFASCAGPLNGEVHGRQSTVLYVLLQQIQHAGHHADPRYAEGYRQGQWKVNGGRVVELQYQQSRGTDHGVEKPKASREESEGARVEAERGLDEDDRRC